MRNRQFSGISRRISETVQDRTIVHSKVFILGTFCSHYQLVISVITVFYSRFYFSIVYFIVFFVCFIDFRVVVLSVYNVFGCYGVSINGWMDGWELLCYC